MFAATGSCARLTAGLAAALLCAPSVAQTFTFPVPFSDDVACPVISSCSEFINVSWGREQCRQDVDFDFANRPPSAGPLLLPEPNWIPTGIADGTPWVTAINFSASSPAYPSNLTALNTLGSRCRDRSFSYSDLFIFSSAPNYPDVEWVDANCPDFRLLPCFNLVFSCSATCVRTGLIFPVPGACTCYPQGFDALPRCTAPTASAAISCTMDVGALGAVCRVYLHSASINGTGEAGPPWNEELVPTFDYFAYYSGLAQPPPPAFLVTIEGSERPLLEVPSPLEGWAEPLSLLSTRALHRPLVDRDTPPAGARLDWRQLMGWEPSTAVPAQSSVVGHAVVRLDPPRASELVRAGWVPLFCQNFESCARLRADASCFSNSYYSRCAQLVAANATPGSPVQILAEELVQAEADLAACRAELQNATETRDELVVLQNDLRTVVEALEQEVDELIDEVANLEDAQAALNASINETRVAVEQCNRTEAALVVQVAEARRELARANKTTVKDVQKRQRDAMFISMLVVLVDIVVLVLTVRQTYLLAGTARKRPEALASQLLALAGSTLLLVAVPWAWYFGGQPPPGKSPVPQARIAVQWALVTWSFAFALLVFVVASELERIQNPALAKIDADPRVRLFLLLAFPSAALVLVVLFSVAQSPDVSFDSTTAQWITFLPWLTPMLVVPWALAARATRESDARRPHTALRTLHLEFALVVYLFAGAVVAVAIFTSNSALVAANYRLQFGIAVAAPALLLISGVTLALLAAGALFKGSKAVQINTVEGVREAAMRRALLAQRRN